MPCRSPDVAVARPEQEQSYNLIETADIAGDFGTLLAEVDPAGLTATLQSGGPFTVFAPTDAAIAALPEGTVEALLNDIPALTSILLFHVAGEKLTAADVLSMESITTLEGSSAEVMIDDGVVTIAGAPVSVTDIPSANGVIHVIDAVMLP